MKPRGLARFRTKHMPPYLLRSEKKTLFRPIAGPVRFLNCLEKEGAGTIGEESPAVCCKESVNGYGTAFSYFCP